MSGSVAQDHNISQIQISEVHDPHARLNNDNQQQNQRRSLFDYLTCGVKCSKKNLLKGVFLTIILIGTIWMASTFFNQTLVKERTPFSFGASSKNVQQIAGPDQIAYKSFYYYRKMVELAKKNVQNDETYYFGQEDGQEFAHVDFWELYQLFKVVKAIQLANEWDDVSPDDSGKQTTDDSKYDSVDNLNSPVNLTNYFNKPSDQAMCGSCYSFPIAATIQYQITKLTGQKIKLSQQELIDCSNPDPQANGCQEGNMTRGFEYAQKHGLVEEKQYPYRSQTGHSYTCNENVLNSTTVAKYGIKGFRSLNGGDCKAIQYELVKGNAVASMINTGKMNEIKNYSEPFRDCIRTNPNHAVTIVGQTENQDWIVRNSWGQSWGDKGYFIIRKGNTCGICNHAIVPEVTIQNIGKENKEVA